MQENLPAVFGDPFDAFAAYGQQVGRKNRPFLAFRKGFWELGKDKEEIAHGSRVILDMREFAAVFTRWQDQRPADVRRAVLMQGERPPRREELGDTDKDLWPIEPDADGVMMPRDPWAFSNEVPALFVGSKHDQVEALLVVSSSSGIRSLGTFVTEFAKKGRQHPGKAPLVELNKGKFSMRDKNNRPIDVYFPSFQIVDFTDWPEDSAAAAPAASVTRLSPPTAHTKF